MLRIYCKNSRSYKNFNEGTTLEEMLPEFEFERPFPIVSAKVNNVSQGLRFRVYNNRDIEFLDMRDPSGRRVYSRSLCFLLCKAAEDVFPQSKMEVKHPISNGYFCDLHKADASAITAGDVQKIKERMQEIIDRNVPFHRREVRLEEAIEIFRREGYDDKVRLLETSGQPYVDYYMLGDTVDYYYGRLLPSAGYIQVWDIIPYHNGILLRVPDRYNPSVLPPFVDQPKTFEVFSEDLKWNRIMNLRNAGDVNHVCLEGGASDLIQISEALQEKKLVQIAEEIERRYNDPVSPVRIVLITGPSSSGKTTVTRRLSVQLKACGLRPISFSTDDYFVNRVETPKLPDGSYDFDNFETVDHRALEQDVIRLLRGEVVDMPEFNFVTGRREYNGKHLQMKPGRVLLIEGIHALNPQLIPQVPQESTFKIFISTLTSIALDDHNWVPTSDNRLLRRIVRDYNKGAFSARETINQWSNVRKAEEQWIYPYQENADVMFNSAYLVEFAVLHTHAELILRTVPKNCPEYSEAHRLLKFIHYFIPVSDKEVPPTSLLRAFIGGGSM
ncbi:MAG: nucleoside kinase [Bacteroidales bacterium]|jgi:Uridine kinase|nr:nucleoside kinase [Bacteroidales bacterium]